jgi:hypothetical protein
MATMKKNILSLIILLMFLVPALGNASYLIRLKNGGQLATSVYWTEGKWIFFFCVGGTAGMERKEIDRIETLKTEGGEYIDKTSAIAGNKELPPLPPAAEKAKEPEKIPAEAEPKAEKILSPQEPRKKIDLKPYQDKMATLKAEANEARTRLREAIKNKDLDAEAKAAEDRRKIADETRKLTEELKEKNNGELPADWYD